MVFALSPAQIIHAANQKRVEAAITELAAARAAARVSREAVAREAAAKERAKLKAAVAGKSKVKAVAVKTKIGKPGKKDAAVCVKKLGRPLHSPGECQQCIRRAAGLPGGHKHTCGKVAWSR